MELETLKERLRAAKLHPVYVKGGPGGEGYRFIGSLDEYFEAVQAFRTPVILIWTETFDELDFFHSPGNENELSDGDADLIDLRSIAPALREFKKHVGSIAMYKLSAALTNGSLDFFINEAWWDAFLELRETATDQVDGDLAASEAKSKADQEEKNRDALTALAALIRDPHFARLPTQKAMMAYAVDRIPELQTIDEYVLRAEIQNLHAKIKAKGLDRKR